MQAGRCKLFKVLTPHSVRYNTSESILKFEHCLISNLLIHRLIVHLVDFLVFGYGLAHEAIVFMTFGQRFIILSEQ